MSNCIEIFRGGVMRIPTADLLPSFWETCERVQREYSRAPGHGGTGDDSTFWYHLVPDTHHHYDRFNVWRDVNSIIIDFRVCPRSIHSHRSLGATMIVLSKYVLAPVATRMAVEETDNPGWRWSDWRLEPGVRVFKEGEPFWNDGPIPENAPRIRVIAVEVRPDPVLSAFLQKNKEQREKGDLSSGLRVGIGDIPSGYNNDE